MGFPTRPRIRHGEGDVYQLRIELEGLLPAVWRRVLLSGRASLHDLHSIIQTVFGHDEELGYHVDIDGVVFRDPEEEPHPGTGADAVTIESLGLRSGHRFLHQAEHHGQPWRHVVTVEQLAPRLIGQRLPLVLDAGRAAPPSDCDGVEDYRLLLEAVAHPADAYLLQEFHWLPEDFDPDFADIVSLNASLHRIPKRRVNER